MGDPVEIRFVSIAIREKTRNLHQTFYSTTASRTPLPAFQRTWTAARPQAVDYLESQGRDSARTDVSTSSTNVRPVFNRRSIQKIPSLSSLPDTQVVRMSERSRKNQQFLLAGRTIYSTLKNLPESKLGIPDSIPLGSWHVPQVSSVLDDSHSSQASENAADSTLKYSFLDEAKRRAIEQDSDSSSDDEPDFLSAANKPNALRVPGTIVLYFSNTRRRFVYFAASTEAVRNSRYIVESVTNVRATAKVSGSCMWLGKCLDWNGFIPTKSDLPDLHITSKYEHRHLFKPCLYNHVPGATLLFDQGSLYWTLENSPWPNTTPLSFNTTKETFSFARYRAAHPKLMWNRKSLESKGKTKIVSSSSRAAQKQ